MNIRKKDPKVVRVITLGCSKNIVDSERLIRQFEANNIRVIYDDDDTTKADTVIVNTCGFINDAKKESVDTILAFAKEKRAGSIENLFVMGCLSERYKTELTGEIPEVDAFFGVNDFKPVVKALGYSYNRDLTNERVLTTPAHYAYLKISEGCNRRCSFCAIPMIRGPYYSKPVRDLLSEAQFLASQGVKELILIAQDLSYYGYDLKGTYMLPALLDSLSEVDGIEWIRLHYAYPTAFPVEVLDRMQKGSKICHYIDIPFQHISDRLLKQMKRGHSEKTIKKLLETFRKKVPDIAVRTSLIVGFPGETDKDFGQLCDFVTRSRFERLGVFTYSHEENTWAGDRLRDSVPDAVKKERFRHLMDLQAGISAELNKEKVGKTLKVLIDRKESNSYIGRTQYDSPEIDNEVIVTSRKAIRPGNLYPVTITRSSLYDLYGSL